MLDWAMGGMLNEEGYCMARDDSRRVVASGDISGIVSTGDYGQIIHAVSNTDPENVQQVAASQLALSTSYYENVLTQARRSFIAAIISATVGLIFFIAAVSIFLIHNDLRAGTVSAISGGIVEVISGLNFWLYGRTASQLNSFHIRLDQTQKFLLANSISTKLTGEAHDAALTDLIKSMAAPGIVNDSSKEE